MAGNCIILKKPGTAAGEGGGPLGVAISPGIVSILDASGFDTVTGRYISQGTAAVISAKYLPGSTTAKCPVDGGTMVFMGVTDTADLPGNCCEYTLTWRGLLTALAGRNEQYSETRSVRERLFPDGISGIPNVAGTVKARLLELQSGLTVRSIVTSKPTPPDSRESNTQSPVQGINNPTKGYDVINTVKTYCYPHGWICYAWQSEQPLPGIWFVTAEYKFEHATSSG